MNYQEIDYKNKYLKYKQKYIDARARISNKNKLMSGKNINDLYGGERTWAEYAQGGFLTDAVKATTDVTNATTGAIQYTALTAIQPFQNIGTSIFNGTVLADTAILANQTQQMIDAGTKYVGAVAYSVGETIYYMPIATMNAMYEFARSITVEGLSTNFVTFFTLNNNAATQTFMASVLRNAKSAAMAAAKVASGVVTSIGETINDIALMVATAIKSIVDAIYSSIRSGVLNNPLSAFWVRCCDTWSQLEKMVTQFSVVGAQAPTIAEINSKLENFKNCLNDIYTTLSRAGYVSTVVGLITAFIPVAAPAAIISGTIATILAIITHVITAILGLVTIAWAGSIVDCEGFATTDAKLKTAAAATGAKNAVDFATQKEEFNKIIGPGSFAGYLWTLTGAPTYIATHLELFIIEKIKRIKLGDTCDPKDVAKMLNQVSQIKKVSKDIIYTDYQI